MAFKPLHDRVVVRRVDSEDKTSGGLIIPDSAQEKPAEGEVVSVGAGARDDAGKLIPMELKSGDKILFGKWSGTEVKIDGEELLIMKESDILLLHGCCHNPTGANLNFEQWVEVTRLIQDKNVLPLIDLAYQGFGDGLE